MSSLWFAAATEGNLSTIQKLLASGCEKDLRGDGMRTALHFAVANSRDRIIEALVAAGADLTIRDQQGRTAFAYLLLSGQLQPSRYPLAKSLGTLTVRQQEIQGATSDLTLLPHLASTLCGIPLLDESILHAICLLLELGADVNRRDKLGGTALHYLARKSAAMDGRKLDYHICVIKKLVDAGASPSACHSGTGMSVLRHAMLSGSVELAIWFLRTYPDHIRPEAADLLPILAPAEAATLTQPTGPAERSERVDSLVSTAQQHPSRPHAAVLPLPQAETIDYNKFLLKPKEGTSVPSWWNSPPEEKTTGTRRAWNSSVHDLRESNERVDVGFLVEVSARARAWRRGEYEATSPPAPSSTDAHASTTTARAPVTTAVPSGYDFDAALRDASSSVLPSADTPTYLPSGGEKEWNPVITLLTMRPHEFNGEEYGLLRRQVLPAVVLRERRWLDMRPFILHRTRFEQYLDELDREEAEARRQAMVQESRIPIAHVPFAP